MSLIITGTEELQAVSRKLMSEGSEGAKIFRKGLRAGAKVVADRVKADFPRKTGKAAKSVKVRAMKRQKGRIGVRVGLFAENKGFPYPMGLEGGVKSQPKGGRIRKATKRITVGGRGKRVTDEAGSHAYNALSWRIEPQHNVKRSFQAVEAKASETILKTCLEEMEKVRVK